MFDLTCTDRKRFLETLLSVPEPLRHDEDTSHYGLIVWEEHCVECGQPYCFKTCGFYNRAFDGKCQRFEYGFIPVRLMDRRRAFVCKFRKWGKIEGLFTGQVISRRGEFLLQSAEKALGVVVRWINRIMDFVPGRVGAITVYRHFRKWILHAVGSVGTVTSLFVEVFASQDVVLTCSVYHGDSLLFAKNLDLKSGWSKHDVPLPMIEKGARILLFPEQDVTPTLVFAHLDLLPPKYASFVKCIAWDLDNTLWSGILSEDGPDKLVLNQNAVELIKQLDRRGIVHTIISKNDHDKAWPMIEKFGLEDYFVFPVINWGQKSANLKAIARSMNLGLDAFAFIDDSAFERGDITQNLPMVRVFSEKDISRLAGFPEFSPPISAESALRRFSYLNEMKRRKVELNYSGDHMGFLESCQLRMTIKRVSEADAAACQRCYELIQRTNQLTLTAKRYTTDEYEKLLEDLSIEAYSIHVSDKFGDYGVVGFVATRVSATEAQIIEFVMSCRVAMKRCEAAAVDALAKHYQKQTKCALTAYLVKTDRNDALVSAFAETDFAKGAEQLNGGIFYSIRLGNYHDHRNPVFVSWVD